MQVLLPRVIGAVPLALVVLCTGTAAAQTSVQGSLGVTATVVRTCGVQSLSSDGAVSTPAAVRVTCGKSGATVGAPLEAVPFLSTSLASAAARPSAGAAQVSVMRGTDAMLSFTKLESGTGVRVLVDF